MRVGLEVPEARVEGVKKESLNAHLEKAVSKLDADLQESFIKAFKGCVEVEGSRVYYNDPNGTKPVHWSKAGEMICCGRPSIVDDYQARAMVKWVEDQRFFDRLHAGEQGYASHEEFDALLDGVARIEPTNSEESGRLYRGLSLSPLVAEEIIKGFKRNGYQVLPSKVVDSWSREFRAAQRFAQGGRRGNVEVILINDDYVSGRRIDGVVRTLQEQGRLVNKSDKHPHTNESEVLFMKGVKHVVTGVNRLEDGKVFYVYVKEER